MFNYNDKQNSRTLAYLRNFTDKIKWNAFVELSFRNILLCRIKCLFNEVSKLSIVIRIN